MFLSLNINWEEIWQSIVSLATNVGLKILISLFIWFFSFKIINIITKKLRKKFAAKNADKTISKVFCYIFSLGLKIVILTCLLGYLGIETTSISAIIASLGVGIGLALNGTLANFAGGVIIILTRPFRIDDYIEALGYSGTVEDIRIVCTVIRTPDNKVVYLPNGTLSSGVIVNYSEKDIRRVDLTFSISYNNSFAMAKKIIEDICLSQEKILNDPAFAIRVSSHSASSIDISVKVWTKNSDYWDVYFSLLEEVKEAFDKNGIEIPYNQLDVHIKN